MAPENDSIQRAARIAGTAAFVEHVGILKTAEFIVDLQEAVDGLGRNNASFCEAFRTMRAAPEKQEQGESCAPKI